MPLECFGAKKKRLPASFLCHNIAKTAERKKAAQTTQNKLFEKQKKQTSKTQRLSLRSLVIMGSLDETSLKLRRIFTLCQDDSEAISKSVARFKKVWGQCSDDEDEDAQDQSKTKKHFFSRFTHYLQLPLAAKERTPYVDRCLEVVCRFASSFLEKQDEDKKGDDEVENKMSKMVTISPTCPPLCTGFLSGSWITMRLHQHDFLCLFILQNCYFFLFQG